jgi:hypothetical protein
MFKSGVSKSHMWQLFAFCMEKERKKESFFAGTREIIMSPR